MSANIVNQVAYLRTSREFPEEIHQLAVESNKSYVDVANAVNARTIGIYPTNRPAITGNSYFLLNQRQQTLRQVYVFDSTIFTSGTIPIGFKIANISQIVLMFGTYTDGTNVYGLIPSSNVAITGQISFYIAQNASPMSDVITFVSGAGAPSVTSGLIVLEWISRV
jgi:hypothetical protein